MPELPIAFADRQRSYYAGRGLLAFGEDVPFRLSTSRAMARLLAQASLAFAARQGKPRVRLVDIGAGTGRLGYHLVTHPAPRELNVTLVEGAASMVRAWEQHRQLAPLARQGRLRFVEAQFEDHERFAAALHHDDDEAVVVVGTYLLDTLAHEWLEGGTARVAPVDVGRRPLFDEAAHDPFLRAYATRLQRGVALVPTGSFALVSAIERVLRVPTLVLFGDKGVRTLTDVSENVEHPRIARHGDGASVAVNFDALRCWLGWRGWVEVPEADDTFIIGGTVLNGRAHNANLAAHLAMTTHPLEAQRQVTAARHAQASEVVKRVLALPVDGDALLEVTDALDDAVQRYALDLDTRTRLGEWLLESARAAFFFERDDTAFHAARVLYRLGYLGAAASCFAHSLEHHGDVLSTRFNLALCLAQLGEAQRARDEVETVLRRAPDHRGAQLLLAQLA